MKFEVKELKSHQVEIIAEVDKKQFIEYKNIASRKISKENKIPGFRPGKAPYDVIVRIYGEDLIEERAIDEIINPIYKEIIEKSEIKPYGPGKLDEIISKNPPKFKFTIPLEPDVKVKDYKKIRQSYKLPKVQDKEVDEVVGNLQLKYATPVDVDRVSKDGDLVSVKVNAVLKEPVEGEPPEILKDTPHQVILGDHPDEEQFPFKGFMNHLKGLKKDDSREFSQKFEKDSVYDKLKGKEVDFSIVINEVKELQKPDVNEDFAKMVGTDTVENLRKSIRDQLETNKKNDYENDYFDKLLNKLVSSSTLKYPPEMLENEINDVLSNFEQNIAQQNMDLDTYLKINSREKEEFISSDIEPAAIKRLEQALVLEEISKQEKIEVDQKELQSEYTRSFFQMQSAPDYKKLQKRMTTKKISDALVLQAASRIMHQNTLNRLKQIANNEEIEKKDEQEQTNKVPAADKENAEKPAKE